MFLSGQLEYAYSTSKKQTCNWFELGEDLNQGHVGLLHLNQNVRLLHSVPPKACWLCFGLKQIMVSLESNIFR